MTLSHGFRRLANALENLEANGVSVRDVATTDDEPGERLTVDLTVTVPLDGTELPDDATVADDDAASDATDAGADESERSDESARERVLDALAVSTAATNGATQMQPTAGDEVVDCPVADCDATFESDHGMKIHRTKVHGDDTDGSDAGAPAYRDPERLREVYAACDSFTEMREALATDVSTQTVRRQMIAHDIYEPGQSGSGSAASKEEEEDESADPAGESETVADDEAEAAIESDEDGGNAGDHDADIDADEEATNERAGSERAEENQDSDAAEEAQSVADEQPVESEQPAADEATDDHPELDAIELPEGVSVADLRAAVSSAQTLYHVQQRFDLDRTDAMQLLETYDLLELVHGRVSHRDARKEIGEEEITRRILEHAPVTEPSRV